MTPKQHCPDISLAHELMEWAPRVQLRNGPMRTLAHFEELLLKSDRKHNRLPVY
jgi:UDP-glucuronate decarboxylase